jgi:hypothetical protein
MRHRLAGEFFLLLAAAVTLAALSCSGDTGSWYPTGTVIIASFYEAPESGTCEITLELANSGRSPISSYCVSIAVATDVRTYYKTIYGDLPILPGGRAYVYAEIVYADDAESLAAGGLTVVDAFFQ